MSRNPGSVGSPRWRPLIASSMALAALMLASSTAQEATQDAPKAEKKARKKRDSRETPRHLRMDYGQFLMATIKAPAPSDNNAMKGIAIRLGGEATKAAVCFDTDLLRVSAGWTGGFLKLLGTPFDGSHGSWPAIDGEQIFGTKQGPGWADADGSFKDPRPEPFGPLPSPWAKYKGLYRSGDKVVLSYTVGSAPVLEMPRIEGAGGETPVITRTFNVGPTTRPLTLAVFDLDEADSGGVGPVEQPNPTDLEGPTAGRVALLGRGDRLTVAGLVDAPKGATWKVVDDKHRVVLSLPASAAPIAFKLVVGALDKANLAKFAGQLGIPDMSFDLAGYTKGGPSEWKETVETKGQLGTGEGAYVVDTITAPDQNPYNSWIRFGGMDFFANGTSAALSTWSGDVWTVTGIDKTLEKLTWKRMAAGLFQPLGLRIVDEQVYVLGRDGITRLTDLDGDGEADFYEAFNHDMAVTTGFHEFAFDLQTDPEGNFYFSKAGPVKGGGRGFDTIAANSGTLMKVYKDGKTLVNYATGFRAPNGIGVGPEGQVTSGDNEGTWMPKCRLNLVKPGGFYGVVDLAHRDEMPTIYDEPICWFPKDVDNSGGGQAWVTSDRWGPFQGRLLHTSYGTCSLYLALIDQQDDHIQGGVVKFPVNFLSGIMRPRFNPVDGQLYIAGLRGWQSSAAQDACFQRVRYTGEPANMVTGLKVIKTGLELTFTDKLDPEDATDPDAYEVERWNYLWCSEYGSDDYSAETPDFQAKVRELNRLRLDPAANAPAIAELTKSLKKGHDEVKIESAKLSEDGKTVTLEIEDLKPVMQMRIRGRLRSADGQRVPVEVYNTINYVP
ncbi:DUF6797 domain-containing protein [Tundrisphaera lichenicola]|uniref:DUF6797 domain-containing protein n=1 Tax=Tundrisphaera lichenicola TaxID=2029860 RepID=UPI003EB99969